MWFKQVFKLVTGIHLHVVKMLCQASQNKCNDLKKTKEEEISPRKDRNSE